MSEPVLQQSRERFVRVRGESLPDFEVGRVHGIRPARVPQSEPFILERAAAGPWEAVCGRRVKVIFADEFTGDTGEACPECAERLQAMQGGAVPWPEPQYVSRWI